ncbi:MAG: 4'-phosphopantetheinyl transferase superfamily protein [Eubacteriales bacterium]|nr:4'-phosphopantetheinyl transferase superfamily protein [Eubacteriales bacterium]
MRQEKGRIRLYLADIRPLYREELLRRAYRLSAPERQKKADACRGLQKKAASLTAGLLADYAKRQNGYGDCLVWYGESGQPCLEIKKGRRPVWLSLSHSGDYAVCAFAFCPVGVDLQQERPVRSGLLRHFLAPGEGTEGLEIDPGRFFRLWTVKESAMKLTGRGMALGFDRVRVDLEGGSASFLETAEEEAAGRMVCREYPAPEGYWLSACFWEDENSREGT